MKTITIKGFTVYLNEVGKIKVAVKDGRSYYPFWYYAKFDSWSNVSGIVTPAAFRSGLRRATYKFA